MICTRCIRLNIPCIPYSADKSRCNGCATADPPRRCLAATSSFLRLDSTCGIGVDVGNSCDDNDTSSPLQSVTHNPSLSDYKLLEPSNEGARDDHICNSVGGNGDDDAGALSIAVRCAYARAQLTSILSHDSSSSTGDIVVKKDPIARIDGNMTYDVGHAPLSIDTCDGSSAKPLFTIPNPASTCIGNRFIFEVNENSPILIPHLVENRVKHNPNNNNVAYIENTNYNHTKFKRECRGLLVAVGTTSSSPNKITTWQLGIIASQVIRTQTFDIHHELHQYNKYEGRLSIYLWDGKTDRMADGSIFPSFFLESNEKDLLQHLTLTHFDFTKECQFEMKYINQFSGIIPAGGCAAINLTNEKDGCVQCSPEGGDSFPTKIRRLKDNHPFLKPLSPRTVTESDTMHPPIIQNNKQNYVKRRGKSIDAARVADEKDVATINRAHKKILTSGATVNVAVVTKSNGDPLTTADTTNLEEQFEHCYFVPNADDIKTDHLYQRVYAISATTQHKDLMKLNKNGLPVSELTHEFMCNHSIACIHTICVNKKANNDKWSYVHSQIFAGNSAPPIEDVVYEPYACPQLGLTVHMAILPARQLQPFTALHTSLVDPQFHDHHIETREVEVMKKCFSNSGSYKANRMKKRKKKEDVSTGAWSQGHNTYIGTKTELSPSLPTPSEGPGMRSESSLYRATTNMFFFPKALHLLTALASTIILSTSIFYRPLEFLLGGRPEGVVFWANRIIILTIKFYNKSHTDKGDFFSDLEIKEAYTRAKRIIDSPLTIQTEKVRMENFLAFIDDFSLSILTTCGVQYVRTALGMQHMNTEVEVYQVFLMLGLGSSLRMCNYMTHIFFGAVFQHCTCMPLFIVDEKVYFGSHPYIDIVNWGNGSGNTSKSKAKKKMASEQNKVTKIQKRDRKIRLTTRRKRKLASVKKQRSRKETRASQSSSNSIHGANRFELTEQQHRSVMICVKMLNNKSATYSSVEEMETAFRRNVRSTLCDVSKMSGDAAEANFNHYKLMLKYEV